VSDLEQRLLFQLAARVELLESRFRAGQHGLGWDSVRWVTTSECARVFGVTQTTVQTWCAKGWIPAARWPNPYNRKRQHRYLIPAFWLMGLPELARPRVEHGRGWERRRRAKEGPWYARVDAWNARRKAASVDPGNGAATLPPRGPGPAGGV
jgi:hypothetical protein